MTTKLPLVSAIIPTYNRAFYVCQAVESALTQNYPNLEIVVVDDGSTDDTRSRLSAYETYIQYIHQANQGVSAARNAAIAASRGEYIALLDSDDVWFPGKLTRQMDFLAAHPEVGMVASHAIAIDRNGKPLSERPLYAFQIEGWVSLEINILRSPLPPTVLVIRRDCLPMPVPFTPGVRFGEDWEMCLRVGARWPIWFIAEPLAGVRVHDSNVTMPLASQQQVDLRLQSRLDVIERVFPALPGDRQTLHSLRAKAEAREYAETAVPSYANGSFETGASRLGKAVTLDPATWQGEELVVAICHFARLLFQTRGAEAALEFIQNVFSHLPPEIKRPDRLSRPVHSRTLIFTIGFNSLAQHKPREAAASIVKGLMWQPTQATNIGVLSTLVRSMARSLQR